MKKLLFIGMVFFCLNLHAQWDPFINHGVFVSEQEGKLSLQCDNIRLSVVLQTLAEQLSLNILFTEALDQPVSMNLKSIPKEDVLNHLLRAYALQSEVRDNLLIILPLAPLQATQGVKTYILKYANAKELAETLKARVQASFDARTNALIIYNLEGDGKWLDMLIHDVDVPAKQVYIEATIMNASAQFSQELGLRFRMDEFSIANLPEHLPLKVAIAAAQENHQTNIIANPKLLTVNLQEAHIKQGRQLAYQETSASGATTLNFQEAALELKVTPMITPEHDIVLSLLVKQDMIGSVSLNGQPTIDTKSIQAKVRVKDGETIVLGGIYSQVDNTRRRHVPGLGRLPLIGIIFQENRQNDDKDELLIFVTPRVVI